MTDTVIDENQEITLKLDNEEAEIVKDLLGNYAYAYRSDQEVDCKRELVRKEKIGKYPYFETAPDPELTNPYVDWTVPKWRSRDENNGSASTQVLEQAQKAIDDLQAKDEKFDQAMKLIQQNQQVSTQQSLALTQGLQAVTKGQEQTNKAMASMQQILLSLKEEQDKATQATPKADAPTTDASNADTTQPATDATKNTNDNK